MRRGAAALAAFAVLATASFAQAQAFEHRVIHREVLAVDRPIVDLAPWIARGDAPVRVELRGSITSHVDGSTFDALSRWDGDTRLTSDQPWLIVPDGAQIVREDPAAHRYVIEIPRGGSARFELLVRRLAHEHFLTPSELEARTTGAIEVLLVEPVPVAVQMGVAPAAIAGEIPLAAYMAGGAGVPLAIVLLLGVARRRRRRPDRILIARARRAVKGVEREVERLGPAFADVAAATRRMLDGALSVQRHLEEVRGALRRTRDLRSHGARERRGELHRAAREAVDRLAQIVDRLETTATRLAAQTASHAAARDVDRLLATLEAEFTTAKSADDEARAA